MHHLTYKVKLCIENINTLCVYQVKQRLSEFFYPYIAKIMIGLAGGLPAGFLEDLKMVVLA